MSSAPAQRPNPLLVGACCTAIATLIPVSLYQLRVLRTLPDPPLALFDSVRITNSKAAHPFGIPDGPLGLASFGITLTLIVLEPKSPNLCKPLGLKLTADAIAAAANGLRQVIQFRKLCSWCTATSLSAMLMAYVGRQQIRNAWSALAEGEL